MRPTECVKYDRRGLEIDSYFGCAESEMFVKTETPLLLIEKGGLEIKSGSSKVTIENIAGVYDRKKDDGSTIAISGAILGLHARSNPGEVYDFTICLSSKTKIEKKQGSADTLIVTLKPGKLNKEQIAFEGKNGTTWASVFDVKTNLEISVSADDYSVEGGSHPGLQRLHIRHGLIKGITQLSIPATNEEKSTQVIEMGDPTAGK
ncbi:hypothetical protein IB642_01230 [Allofrancisella guangzhouensis]|uniref:Uncharacterized protein n=1 Tax=Allofrancisella guangzhouensis TaxID=594679 RepID=A0A0A8E5C1_9GAMM|nr:hypothetical protein [Allofrancisella guangzhouensis]AJC49425.1 hypothetical protein SD28_07245 [Allofrancisella guangzhouensis]MBK2026716.1 hypothetical protein [Allofrancisella guangzhouensis]MBK2043641.1 hypothetical protein [Allofrancisella guangzhouensis]MBK2046204.1 hypothetical protein [Allofrancisella guangzhouensis]